MSGLTPARLQEHAFISVDRAPSCAICSKAREGRPHSGVWIDRRPENAVTFPNMVTVNESFIPPEGITVTTVVVPAFA